MTLQPSCLPRPPEFFQIEKPTRLIPENAFGIVPAIFLSTSTHGKERHLIRAQTHCPLPVVHLARLTDPRRGSWLHSHRVLHSPATLERPITKERAWLALGGGSLGVFSNEVIGFLQDRANLGEKI